MSIRTRKRGKTYSYIFEAGKDSDGRRRVVEKGGFPDKASAYDAGIEAYQAFLHGGITAKDGKIFFEDFAEQWLQHVRGEVKLSSYLLYRNCVYSLLNPKFGKKLITELTPFMFDSWLQEKARNGTGKKTLETVKGILHTMLSYAVYPCRLILVNPVDNIKISKQAPINIIRREIVTKDLYEQLLSEYPINHPYHIIIRLLYNTGLRINEILGLQWCNFREYVNSAIVIKNQIKHIRGVGKKFETPKSHAGNRVVYLDTITIQAINEWQRVQQEQALFAGDSYKIYFEQNEIIKKVSQKIYLLNYYTIPKLEFVCTRRDGELVSYAAIQQMLKKHGTNAHSFRHTHATRLVEAGASIKAVAGRLGQSTLSLTADLYTHNTDKMQKDLVRQYEDSLKQTNNKN